MDAHSPDFGTITTPCNTACVPQIPCPIMPVQWNLYFFYYFILFLVTELQRHHKTRAEHQKPGVWPEQAAGLAADAEHCSPATARCKWRKHLKAAQSLLDTRLFLSISTFLSGVSVIPFFRTNLWVTVSAYF